MTQWLGVIGLACLVVLGKWVRSCIHQERDLRPVRQAAALEILAERSEPVSSYALRLAVEARVQPNQVMAFGEWFALMEELTRSGRVCKVRRSRGKGLPAWRGYVLA